MRDQATQASEPVNKVKTVDVVFPMDLHGSLNDAELKQLGRLQRQLAREFVDANAEDKQLEVYTKKSSYKDLPGLVFEPEMPGSVVGEEELGSPDGPGGVVDEEQCSSPEGPGGDEDAEELSED